MPNPIDDDSRCEQVAGACDLMRKLQTAAVRTFERVARTRQYFQIPARCDFARLCHIASREDRLIVAVSRFADSRDDTRNRELRFRLPVFAREFSQSNGVARLIRQQFASQQRLEPTGVVVAGFIFGPGTDRVRNDLGISSRHITE